MAKLRILLADDHAILREGLALLIAAQPDMEVIAQARGGREAVTMARQFKPDLVVLDVSMPDMRGTEAAGQIRLTCPGVRILALTRHADQGYLRRMLRAGASGYVLKRTAGDGLIEAMRTIATGGAYVDPSMAGALVARLFGTPESNARLDAGVRGTLTEREQQVLKLIAWGQSNKEAAADLGISTKTVESYKASALEKLHLRSRTDIVRYALSQRWLSDDDAPE